MNTTVIIALVSVGVSILSFFGNYLGSQRAQAGHQAVIDEKIDTLTKQVEKHNNIMQRTFVLEAKVESIEERLRK